MKARNNFTAHAGCVIFGVTSVAAGLALVFAEEVYVSTSSTFWPRAGGLLLMCAATGFVAWSSREWRSSISLLFAAVAVLYHGFSEVTAAMYGHYRGYRWTIGTDATETAYVTLYVGVGLAVFGFVHFVVVSSSREIETDTSGYRQLLHRIDRRILYAWFAVSILYHAGLKNVVGATQPFAYILRSVCLNLFPFLVTLFALKIVSLYEEGEYSGKQTLVYGIFLSVTSVFLINARLFLVIIALSIFVLSHKWDIARFRLRFVAAAIAFMTLLFVVIAGIRMAVGRGSLQEASPREKITRTWRGLSTFADSRQVQSATAWQLKNYLGHRFDGNATFGAVFGVRSTRRVGVNFEVLLPGAIATVPSALWPAKLDLPPRWRNPVGYLHHWLGLPRQDLTLTPQTLIYSAGGFGGLLVGMALLGAALGWLDVRSRVRANFFILMLTVCTIVPVANGIGKSYYKIWRTTLILWAVVWAIQRVQRMELFARK